MLCSLKKCNMQGSPCNDSLLQESKACFDTLAAASKQYGFEANAPEERRRLVLTLVPVHWSAEWLRPVNPDYILIGPVLAGPGKPLPAEMEVPLPSEHAACPAVCLMQHHSALGCDGIGRGKRCLLCMPSC